MSMELDNYILEDEIMFYCQQKEYPYFVLKSVSDKDVTCTELIEDAMQFRMRKQAESMLKSCDESMHFEIKSTNGIYTEVWSGSKNLYNGNFDSKADCKKFLIDNGFLMEGYKVEFTKSKFRKDITIVTIK